MLVLVVALAFIIIVIVVAAVLSIRLGRADDTDDEVEGPRGRYRGARDADDHRWSSREGRSRRMSAALPGQGSGREAPAARGKRPAGRSPRSRDENAGYRSRGYDGRGDANDQQANPRSRSAARPAAARAPGDRGARPEQGRHGAGQHAYDAAPLARAAAGEFAAAGFPAADYPSAEFPSMEFPSGESTSGQFTGSGFAAADYPSEKFGPAGYPSGEFPPGGYASAEPSAADFPSGDVPAVRSAARLTARRGEPDRADQRRRDEKPRAAATSRSRPPRGKDSAEWSSADWDKLSDEQYWAELSADKPFTAPARGPESPAPTGSSRSTSPRQQSGRSESRAGRDAPRGKNSRVEAARAGSARPQAPAAVGQSDTEPKAERARSGRTTPREAPTERLPVRSPQQQDKPAAVVGAAANARAAAPSQDADPSLAMLASLASAPSSQSLPYDDDPLTSPSFSRNAIGVIDSRSYGSTRQGEQAEPVPYQAGGADSGPPQLGYADSEFQVAPHPQDMGVPANAYPPASYGGPADYPVPSYAPAAASAAEWYAVPAEAAQALANPYGGYTPPAPAPYHQPNQAIGYTAGADTVGYAGYPGDQAAAYPHPGYGEPVAAPVAEIPYQAASGSALPAPQMGSALPYSGPPDQSASEPQPGALPQSVGYGPDSYAPGYAGYTDPYPPEAYGGYPAHG